MKLGISNIAWEANQDKYIYQLMNELGYSGLEIAPTRIFENAPYERLEEARVWKKQVYSKYGFEIPSMQSIWYGKNEKIFGSKMEREELLNYTKKAIDFAESVECSNLVFGSPKNRNRPLGAKNDDVICFFRELGEYAIKKQTVIGMEANPSIYNTNFMTNTKDTLEFIKKVNSRGFLLNLDIGTMIQNEEDPRELEGNIKFVNHVHVSEPYLTAIKPRELHKEVLRYLKKEDYSGFISIEMGKSEDVEGLKSIMQYVKEIFGDE